MNKAVRFIKTAGIYFVGNILTRMIGFFLLPLYTKNLSPSEFGNYDLIISIISFLVPVVFFQIWDGMFRFGFEKNKIKEKYDLISNSFFVFIIGAIIYTIIYTISFVLLKQSFSILIFFYGILFALQYQYSFIARVFLENKLFVSSGVLNTLVTAISNIVMIIGFGMREESLYLSSVIGMLVQVIMIEIKLSPLRKFTRKAIHKNEIINMIRFSVPLCIATISYWLLSGYTKVCISQQLGVYENGLYAVANKFSIMISLVVSVFQYAWNEIAYMMARDENRKDQYHSSIEYIVKVILLGSGISILFIKLIFPYLIDRSYLEALQIIPLALIGVAVNSLAGFLGTIFMTEKKTKYILWTTIISAIINILTTDIFIKLWGLQGATAALCLSFTILAVIRISIISNMFKFKIAASYLIDILLLIIAVYIFYNSKNIITLLAGICILVIAMIYGLRKLVVPLVKSILNEVGVLK